MGNLGTYLAFVLAYLAFITIIFGVLIRYGDPARRRWILYACHTNNNGETHALQIRRYWTHHHIRHAYNNWDHTDTYWTPIIVTLHEEPHFLTTLTHPNR